ncbi:MAG: YfjI family protein [Actinomycetota bacterium]|nr:YfjI family protein [Actinomycetota bacterium]
MARAKREGSTLGMVLREAWGGGRLAVLNRTQLCASSSHVAIAAHITPTEFRLKYAKTEMSGGTLNRFLPVFVERNKLLPVPPPMDLQVLAHVTLRLKRAIAEARKITRIDLGDDAVRLWSDQLYTEFTDGDTPASEFTRRAAPYCLRIAGLYAVLDGRRLISADDLTAAAAVVRYAIQTARYVLDAVPRDPRLDRLRRALDRASEGLTRSEISALFSAS